MEGEGGVGWVRVRVWVVGGCLHLPSLCDVLTLRAGSLECAATQMYLQRCEGLWT